MSNQLLARISRDFLLEKCVYQYRMKKINELSAHEIIECCHWYCEEHYLTAEFQKYREKTEAGYCYCHYLMDYVPQGDCYDLQMIKDGFITTEALPEMEINKEKLSECCLECRYQL